MRTIWLRLGGWAFFAGAVFLLGATAYAWFTRWQELDGVADQQKIARTLEIIRTSTPSDHKVLKVLFYGQSITRSGWHNLVVAHWRKKYPNTIFVVENRALGGFASQSLVRTTEQDIAAFYPDLIIFHVYGDHRAYEKILRMFRSLTAADVILQTDHGDGFPDPPCAEPIKLSLHNDPGCAGMFWVHQRLWHDEMSYHKIPAFAKKYQMAMEPQRKWWRDYLLEKQINPQSLLMSDGLHPNEKGNELIARFFNAYFDSLVDKWTGQKEQNVTSVHVTGEQISNGRTTVVFHGSRLELLSRQALAVRPVVTIDDRAPEEFDGCYLVTRSTALNSVPDWPALRRITLLHDHLAEDWTVTIVRMGLNQKSFDFSVRASVTGDEGHGTSAHNFVSRSGRLSIDAEDWMFARGYELKPIPLQVPAEVHWSVQNICAAKPETVDLQNGQMQYRYVLVSGSSRGEHAARLSYLPNDLADAIEFRAYQPPLSKY